MKIRTITIEEHYNDIIPCSESTKNLIPGSSVIRSFVQDRGDNTAFSVSVCHQGLKIETNYFIGVDWIVDNKIAIKVDAKLNKGGYEVNYLEMLQYAMSNCNDVAELDNLIHIDFSKPHIPIEQSYDRLSFFLTIEFLSILKKIVNKGLKKAYYQIKENLSSKIKGKVLTTSNLVLNHTKGDYLHNYCRYNEYGIDCDENRFLKYVLGFVSHLIDNEYAEPVLKDKLKKEIRYIKPFFANVSNVIDIRKMKNFKPNALYKEYPIAIQISNFILKRHSYNYTDKNSICRETPPFWIDMSRLFELYVYNKLKESVGEENVLYHNRYTHKQEPDYLMKSAIGRSAYIIDAKYKPRYEESNKGIIDDIRQVSGYSRISKIYEDLDIEDMHSNIPCIIIYPSYTAPNGLDLKTDEVIQKKSSIVSSFIDIFKIGINLPKITPLP